MRRASFSSELLWSFALVAVGQLAIQMLGRVAPALVRYPGPWRPTAAVDTAGYLTAASSLPSVDPSSTTKLAYLTLIRIDQVLGSGGWFLLALQVILLVVAGWSLLRYVGDRWGRRAGILAAAVLVMNPHVTQWTKTLLTEPVFMPFVVLLVVLLAVSSERPGWTPVAAGLALLVVLVRPNGLGVLLGAAAVLSSRLRRARAITFLATVAAVVVVVVVTPAFQSPGGEENTLANRTYEGLVVWADPHDVNIPMPRPDDPTDLSNAAVIRYALQHPGAVLELGARRIVAELLQVRSHYPRTVNAIIAVQMAVLYGLAAIGFVRSRRDPLTSSVLAVSAGLFLVIAATWAIAEGRFGWAVFATWSPWVGIGADALLPRSRRSGMAPSDRS